MMVNKIKDFFDTKNYFNIMLIIFLVFKIKTIDPEDWIEKLNSFEEGYKDE